MNCFFLSNFHRTVSLWRDTLYQILSNNPLKVILLASNFWQLWKSLLKTHKCNFWGEKFSSHFSITLGKWLLDHIGSLFVALLENDQLLQHPVPLYSHQKGRTIPLAPLFQQYLVLKIFYIWAVLISMYWYPMIILFAMLYTTLNIFHRLTIFVSSLIFCWLIFFPDSLEVLFLFLVCFF